jgi:hypothetical protein
VHVIETPAERAGIVARKRGAHEIGRAGRLACHEQPLERPAALGEQPLELAAAPRDARRLGARARAVGGEPRQAAVRFRDRALGIAQRVARLAARGFLRFELALQRLDAAAQLLQLGFARRPDRRGRGEGERQSAEADQTLALPCADTAAVRRATSSASPR